MKKVILCTGAMLLIASVALAGPPKKADKKKPAEKAPTTIKCAVMPDHEVNIKEATGKKMFKDFKGRRYFFCCAGCPGAFDKEPEKFAKAASLPAPKK